jgi:hypothetical protein
MEKRNRCSLKIEKLATAHRGRTPQPEITGMAKRPAGILLKPPDGCCRFSTSTAGKKMVRLCRHTKTDREKLSLFVTGL